VPFQVSSDRSYDLANLSALSNWGHSEAEFFLRLESNLRSRVQAAGLLSLKKQQMAWCIFLEKKYYFCNLKKILFLQFEKKIFLQFEKKSRLLKHQYCSGKRSGRMIGPWILFFLILLDSLRDSVGLRGLSLFPILPEWPH
jgi:hypothetical protein